jgi:hypothetical protein
VLTPHQGVFDRTAFEDDASGQGREDLVLEPIVVERPAVNYQREPAPTPLAQTSRYLAESPPGHRSRPPAYERGPAYLREPDPSHVPRPRAARTYPPPTTSRRAPPPTATQAPRSTHSHRRREGAGLETSLGHGIPGRGIILLGHTAAFAIAAVDIAVNHELTLFFSLGFVLIGLICALGVRRSDLFTAGVLPPLLLATVVGVFSVIMPSAVGTPSGSISHAWVAGLAHNAGGLVSAHAAALLMIALRLLNEPARRTRAF